MKHVLVFLAALAVALTVTAAAFAGGGKLTLLNGPGPYATSSTVSVYAQVGSAEQVALVCVDATGSEGWSDSVYLYNSGVVSFSTPSTPASCTIELRNYTGPLNATYKVAGSVGFSVT